VFSKQKIRPCLWFDGNAEEAVNFYISVFGNSKILNVARAGDVGPWKKGAVAVTVMTFQLEGQEFMALNGGPQFKFNEAVSLLVNCETQAEVDDLWAKLGAGGKEIACGWLKDRFGLAWQVVPQVLGEMMLDEDRERADRVMKAMMGMVKLDIDALKQAYQGR